MDTGDKVDGVTAHNGLTMDALVASHGIVYVLPTEDEWYKAAYFSGSGYSLYPDASGAPPNAVYNQATPEVVGHLSPEQNGTLNMGGNVWEWLETTAGGEAFNPLNDSQGMVLRGGAYWLPDADDMKKNNRLTNPFLVRGAISEDTGFRIVAIPEPSSLAMIGLVSGCAVFIRRTFMI